MLSVYNIPQSSITVTEDKTGLVTEYSQLGDLSIRFIRRPEDVVYVVCSNRTGVTVEFHFVETVLSAERELVANVYRPNARKYDYLSLSIYNT